jgi:hypothetical protein
VSLSKLMPLLMLLGIGAHSKDALTRRLASVLDLQSVIVTQMDLHTIRDQLVIASIGEENFRITDLRQFIRQHLAPTPDRDTSVDFWGTPYRHEVHAENLKLASAGPDKVFGTADDIEVSGTLSTDSY